MLNTLILIFNIFFLAILFAPVWIRWLAGFHKKVLTLKYSYLPFSLHNFELRYQYKKHIVAQVTIQRIKITKIPNQWRLKAEITDLEIRFIPNQPIKIGFQFEENMYLERLKSRLTPYTEIKIRHRLQKQIPFLQLLIESTAVNCLFLVFSRFNISFNKIKATLPPLNSKEKDLPYMSIQLNETNMSLQLNQNGHLSWSLNSIEANMDSCFAIKNIQVNGTTKPGLIIDLLEEHSSIDVKIEEIIWQCKKEYFYTMDVIANEFWARPDMNKILKRHLNQKGFMLLGKPREMNLHFVKFRIEFTIFENEEYQKSATNILQQKFNKYITNKLVFQWLNLQYYGLYDIKEIDQIKKGIVKCQEFSVYTLSQDIKLTDIYWDINCIASNTIHSNDETNNIIKFGEVIINISPQLIKYFTLIKTELASEFRVYFMENYDQSKYFKKYNQIAKQMCCDFFGVELNSQVETFYDISIINKLEFNLIVDGTSINSISINNFHYVSNEGLINKKQITFDNCIIHSEQNNTEGKLTDFNMQTDESLVNYKFNHFFLKLEQKNVEQIMKIHQQYKVFRIQLQKFTSFKLTSLEAKKQSSQKQESKESIINCSSISIKYCVEHFVSEVFLQKIKTDQPNQIQFHHLLIKFQDKNLLQINEIDIKNNLEHIQLGIKHIILSFEEDVKDINVFLQKIKEMNMIVSRKQIFDISNEENINLNQDKRRSASFSYLKTTKNEFQNETKISSIISKNVNLHIDKFDFVIHDTKLNELICRYRRFQEKFETQKSRQNENRAMEFLKTQQSYALLNISFINIQMNLKKLTFNPTELFNKITKLDSHPTQLDQSFFNYFELAGADLSMDSIQISIRDYKLDLLIVRGIRISIFVGFSKLNTYLSELGLRIFYDFELKIKQVQLTAGLNLIFAFRELTNRMNQIMGDPKNQQAQKVKIKEQLTFWDRFRLKFHGKIRFLVDHLIIQATTDILPYSVDCIRFSSKLINIEFLNWTIRAQADKLKLGRIPKIQKVLFVPRIQMVTEFNWWANKDQFDHYFYMRKPYFNQINKDLEDFISQKLTIEIKADCIQYEYQKDLYFRQQSKSSFFLHYQNQFMRWLKNRPILRHDILRMFSVKMKTIPQQSMSKDMEWNMYADYKTLVHYTYFKLMESLMIKQSLYQHTKSINIRVYSNKFRMFFTNSEKPLQHSEPYLKNKDVPFIGIQTLLQALKFNLCLEPNFVDNEWRFEVNSIAGKFDQLIGGMFDGKQVIDIEAPDALSQQQQFVNFFDIQPVDYFTNESSKSMIFQNMTFTELTKLKKFQRIPFIINTTITPQYHLFDLENEEFTIDEELLDSYQSTRAQRLQQKPQPKNEFNAFDIFLKAQQLEYEQNKQVELQDENENGTQIKTTKFIKNFFSATDSQLLFTFYLQEIWASVFESLEFSESKETYQKQDNKYEQIKEKSYCREELMLMVSLVNPQFNFQYHNANCQMVLASPKDCQIIMSEYILPFDTLEVDKKRVIKLIFNGLDCQTLSKNLEAKTQVRFLSNDYERIVRCDFALFQFQSYQLNFNKRDFTEILQTQTNNPFYWNQELRRPIIQVKVGTLNATLKKYQLDQFLDMINFLEMAATTKNEFENKERVLRNKLKEINQYGAKQIESYIKEKIAQNLERYGSERSKFDYSINETMLQLQDDFENPFIQFNIKNIRVIELLFENDSHKTDILLQDMEAINKMPNMEQDPDYQMVLSQEIKDNKSPFFRMIKKYYPLQIYQQKWFVIDQHDIKMNPLVIKLTDQLYDQFYNYFFGDEQANRPNRLSSERKEQMKNAMENIAKQVPDYYNSLQVSEQKVNATFKHPSKIKRFKDVIIQLEPYKSSKAFSTTKEQFDEFQTFVIKQIVSQIFSILGKKLFD